MGTDPDIIKEIDFKDYPRPVSMESMQTILNQMKNSICKIYRRDGRKGSGFFCIIECGDIKMPTLITNYHVIKEEYIKKYKQICISLNNDENKKTIKLDNNRKNYFNETYDIAMIEIKKKDNINNQYLELDDQIYKEIENTFIENSPIYNISYQNGEKVYVSYGLTKTIKEDQNFIIKHLCITESGSSGSPILNLSNHKVIGLHTAGSKKFSYNLAVILKSPIKEYIKKYKNNNDDQSNNIIENNNFYQYNQNKSNNNDKPDNKINKNNHNINTLTDVNTINNINGNYGWNTSIINESYDYPYTDKNGKNKKTKIKNNEIILKLQVPKEDVNKKIYFINKSFQKQFLNKSNFEITINNQKVNNGKYYFEPKEKGDYKIILKFKFNIKDCSYMFSDCKNITNIDLSSLDTKEVENMSNMFKNCTNLAIINFSEFDTNKVINMENMFFNCIKLSGLNLTSFNTINVINMDGMFSNCSNLSNIEFGFNFSAKNATTNYIFTNCNKYKYKSLTFKGESDDKLLNEFCGN